MHQGIGVYMRGRRDIFPFGYTCDYKDSVSSQHTHDVEGELRSSRCLKDKINCADLSGKLLDRCGFTGEIHAADGLYQLCFGIGLPGTRIDIRLEACCNELHGPQESNWSGP